jgi:Sulfotransferase family
LTTPKTGSASPAPTRLVYLLAASHSGSTLLAQLLGSHPELGTVGELKATSLGDPDRYRCSCGAFIKQCPFWARVRESMARRGLDFDITRAETDIRTGASPYVQRLLRPLHRGPAFEALRDAALALSPAWRAALPRIQRRSAALAASICEVTGKPLVVDSSKIGLRLKYLLRTPGLDVRVIRLIRDGRGVALTYVDPARFADAKDPSLRGGGTGADREAEKLSMAGAAREWRRSNEEAEAVLSGIDRSRWTQARYEDICASPRETLSRLFSFLGVADLEIDTKQERHVVRNGMRLDWQGDIRLDESWRKELGPEQLRDFDAEAGELNRRYGYR